jgi:hypothetical protein
MGSNQHIRQKKRKEKFLDVKLLTTNCTTVQEDIPYHFKKGMVCRF